MLTDTTKRNINFDLEEQGKETSKLGDSLVTTQTQSAGRLKASTPLQEGFASAGATYSLPITFL